MSEQATGKVFEAWNRVITAMATDGIAKNKTAQGYKFRGIDDVLNALASEFARHGLAVRAEYSLPLMSQISTAKGSTMAHAILRGTYTLVSTVDGSSFDAGAFIGEAFDSGDKSVGKAQSYAYKMFALQTFAIPTEGDNDTENHSHERAAAPAKREQPKDDEPRITAGDAKGKRFSEASAAELHAFGATVTKAVDNPATDVGTRDRGVALLRAIDAELAGRK